MTIYEMHRWSEALYYHLHWMCPVSCGFLVFGFFSNLLATCVFLNNWFSYMKLPVYMIILCVLHMSLIFVETLRIFSCLLDAAEDDQGRNDPSLYPVCLYIGWVANLINYTISSVHALVVHNRFKSQTERDVTSSRLNAKRVPIALSTTIAILSIIPASIYLTKKMTELKKSPYLRCSTLYMFPLNKESMTDVVVLMLPVVFDLITLILLIALFIKICLKRRHRKMASRLSLAFTEDEDSRWGATADDDGTGDSDCEWKLHISPSGNLNKLQWGFQELKDRDNAMTKCVVVLALGRMSISVPRHVDMALRGSDHDEMRVRLLLLDDMLLMVYLASTLFIFCIGSVKFRSIIFKYLNEKPRKKDLFTDITLATCSDIMRNSTGPDTPNTTQISEENLTQEEPIPFLLENFKETRQQLRLEHVTTGTAVYRPQRKSTFRKSFRYTARHIKPTDISEGYT